MPYSIAFVAPNGEYIEQQLIGFSGGSMTVGAGTWSFNPGTEYLFVTVKAVTGSGVFVPKTSWTGTWQESQSSLVQNLRYTNYSDANALSVTQDSAAGLWGATGSELSVQVDAAGNLVGNTTGSTFGACSLAGSLTLLTPGSNRNLFRARLTPSGDSTCKLAKSEHVGLGAISFLNTASSGSPVWKRRLMFVVRVPGSSYFSGFAVKQ